MNTMINGLRQLTYKCLRLKSLNFHNPINSLDQLKSFMIEVNKFKALETLEFRLRLGDYEELQTFEKYFNRLQSLTNLTIDLRNKNPIKNDFLKNIDKSLPKLRVLCLTDVIIEVSEQTVDSLARLLRLESIQMEINNDWIRDLINDKVMKNCKKIKSIDIRVFELNSDED